MFPIGTTAALSSKMESDIALFDGDVFGHLDQLAHSRASDCSKLPVASQLAQSVPSSKAFHSVMQTWAREWA